MRALILASLVATGFIAVALAAGDNNGSIVVRPPAAAVTKPPPAPPAPAPAPLVVAPPPAPVPAPAVVETSWPENVPSFKPGTGGVPLVAAKATSPAALAVAASAAGQSLSSTQASAATRIGTQTASLPSTPIPSGPPTKVTLQASIMQGAKPLRDPLVWTISVPQLGTIDQPGTQVSSQNGPKAEFELPQGTYVVTVKDAEAVVNSIMIVDATPISKVIPLNLGIVGLKMIPYTGA
jgi:hypothetical protein